MRAIHKAAILMMVLAGSSPLRADPPEPRCLVPTHRWDGAQPVVAGERVSALPPAITPGHAAMVRLTDAGRVGFATPLGKAIAPGDMGGLVALHVAAASDYRIALQHKAWIDVVQSGQPLASAAHAHGAPCSGVAKIVDFVLTPGDYIIQLSDTADATIGMQVIGQP